MFRSKNPTIQCPARTQLSQLVWRGRDGGGDGTAAIATGFAVLDDYLPGGGWPLTGISEIFIEHYGLGELSILMPALAALCRRDADAGRWIVWIAPPFVPYAPALVHHGIDVDRILLVHPSSPGEALWAVEQVIRSRSSVAVLAWIREAGVTALRRLQLGAESSRCWTVLFRPAAAIEQSSPAALRFGLSPARAATGAGIRVEIRKCRGQRPRSFLL